MRDDAQNRPDIARAFAHLKSQGGGEAETDPIGAMRRFVDRYGDVEPRAPRAGVSVRPVSAAGAPAEWTVADGAAGEDRIVLLHGGGWVAGSLESHRAIAAVLAELTGAAVLAVDYRLAPEHPFPAGLEDGRAALAFAMANGPHGLAPARSVALVGDSAGGNLAAALCQELAASGETLPDVLVLMCPVLDGAANPARGDPDALAADQAALEQVMALYLQGAAPLDDPRVSPLLAPLARLAQFPPTLIQASSADFLLWDARAFADRLIEAGVPVSLSVWPGLPHVWQAFLALLPESGAALQEAADFLKRWRSRKP